MSLADEANLIVRGNLNVTESANLRTGNVVTLEPSGLPGNSIKGDIQESGGNYYLAIVDTATSPPGADWVRINFNGGGLSFWTEGTGITPGNEYSSFSPVNASVDTSVIITPKGNGAFQTNSGGNNRGTNAIDLQMSRSVNNMVASGAASVIGGGRNNRSTALATTVCGGNNNSAGGDYSFVGGGSMNSCSTTQYSTICGGLGHNIVSDYVFVGGGLDNNVLGTHSTISGGERNEITSDHCTIGGGDDNTISARLSTIGGGFTNNCSAEIATVGGGQTNTASGTSSTVSGGSGNTASNTGATVGGGQANQATASNSTVSGGISNIARANNTTIGGGEGNNAGGTHATIAGGLNNQTLTANATIGGGENNIANGLSSTVAGGIDNDIGSSNYCFCAGRGLNLTANNSAALGVFNNPGFFGAGQRIFMVGNGPNAGTPSNAFSVTSDGNCYAQVAFNPGGADFAEWFESGLSEKIAVGIPVVMDNSKIRPAKDGEVPFGVISGQAGFVGNNKEGEWPGKYLKHPNGEPVYEEITVEEEEEVMIEETITSTKLVKVEKDGEIFYLETQISKKVKTPLMEEFNVRDSNGEILRTISKPKTQMVSKTIKREKLNPAFNSELKYIPRSQRPEWNIVGLLGQVPVLKGQPLNPKWQVIKEIDEHYTLMLILP